MGGKSCIEDDIVGAVDVRNEVKPLEIFIFTSHIIYSLTCGIIENIYKPCIIYLYLFERRSRLRAS